jgi:hypothetical protein
VCKAQWYYLLHVKKTGTASFDIEWEDNTYFDISDGDWYAAVAKGVEFVDVASLDFGDYQTVTPVETTNVEFEVEVKSYENYTGVIFRDSNDNGVFDDEDINYSYNYVMAEQGETVSETITIMY